MQPQFILASSSPRRRDLLGKAGFQFAIFAPDVTETSGMALTVIETALCNATRTALAVSRMQPAAVVLGADTLVALGPKIIGKPRDLAEAFEILQLLNGQTHLVCTAVVIRREVPRRTIVFYETTRVEFHRWSELEIQTYLAEIHPLDKAGAYAAQGAGGKIIARLSGSFTNVVGLPMEKTARVLRAFGVSSAEAPPA